jgi:hypothetical protein
MLPPKPKLVKAKVLWARGWLKRLPVIPRHPVCRIGRHLRGMPLQFGEVVEGVGTIEFAGVDQTHKKIPHLGAIERAVKQSVFAMQDSAFQHLFAELLSSGAPGWRRNSVRPLQRRNT